MEVENPTQMKGVVDFDSIPCPIIEPMSPTVVEEKEVSPETKHMYIDPHNMEEEQNLIQQPSVETVQPEEEDEERTELDEPRVQYGMEKSHYD